jgi:hypothetical protein
LAGFAADHGKAEEIEGFRFTEAALCASGRRVAAELDQAGLLRIERRRELLKPGAHRIEEPTGIGLMLEAGHQVSRAAESHPRALAEPDVRLSPHPAPIVQPRP